MSKRMSLRHWLKDERGVSAIEFAMVAPILATLILGIIDFSSAMSQRFSLQQAVNRSLEIVQANRISAGPQGGTPNYDFLKAEVTAAVPGATVTLDQWLECNGSRGGRSYTDECAAGQDTARYLQLRASRVFQGKMYMKPITLVATSAVRVQ
jgi:Flp pilus assembly protein TadG